MLPWFLFAFAQHEEAALEPTMTPDEIVVVRTTDGCELPIRRYEAAGPPVMLVHGMWANHYNWDFRPEVSLAHTLQEQGFDVWVPELRGGPGAACPDRALSFTFDDHALLDLPPAVEEITRLTGERPAWVGHSMGGMLLYAYLREHPDDIAMGVTLSSPASFEHAGQRYALANSLRHLLVGPEVRAREATRVMRLAGPHSALSQNLSGHGAIPWDMALGLMDHAVVDLPRSFVLGATAWIRAEQVVDASGDPWITPSTVPLVALAGGGDTAVPAADVRPICDVFTTCRFQVLSLENGQSRDYGHVDIVLGSTARYEVYPLVVEALREGLGSPVEGCDTP